MRKYKLKKQIRNILIISIITIGIVIAAVLIIKNIRYHNSNTYKLLQVGYQENEIEVINNKLSNSQIEKLINEKHNDNIVKIIKAKYYIAKNYDRYLAYQAINPSTSINDIIAIVNVGADHDWYDENFIADADLTKSELVLVNKFHKLKNEHTPDNLTAVSLMYAYSNNELQEIAVTAFTEMAKAAKEEDLTLIAASSYRSYKVQEKLYNNYILTYGEEYANTISAKQGHSEHQTGLATDILTYNTGTSKFKDTKESEWLIANAYKYGFILRYPENKTYLTGYAYEPWHYRFVGVDVAKKIHNENITFDEYYAYYIEENK